MQSSIRSWLGFAKRMFCTYEIRFSSQVPDPDYLEKLRVWLQARRIGFSHSGESGMNFEIDGGDLLLQVGSRSPPQVRESGFGAPTREVVTERVLPGPPQHHRRSGRMAGP